MGGPTEDTAQEETRGSGETQTELSLPDGLVLRDLNEGDYSKGYMELLSQLTTTGTVTEEQFKDRFALLSQRSLDYRIVVVEDTVSNRVVGTGTLLIEFKFLRSCGKVGHIEDIVVHSSMRGKHLGHRIIQTLTDIAKKQGCYKVILDCDEKNVDFYKKCGYSVKNVGMALYF
ncbi:unnamed protein product [Closterium sp. Naga37s-1]|nr:unnamed protein product [Closterium sp. Naga37s-1]